MMLREGTSLEEFLQCLEEEDALTNRDVLVKSGQQVTLECVRETAPGTKDREERTLLPKLHESLGGAGPERDPV